MANEKFTKKELDDEIMQIIQQSNKPLQIQRQQQIPNIASMFVQIVVKAIQANLFLQRSVHFPHVRHQSILLLVLYLLQLKYPGLRLEPQQLGI